MVMDIPTEPLCGLSGEAEILRYLLKRFPNLAGFECDPSLHYARTNPGSQRLLPGGYTNEFITGPMLSPHVWGSLATEGKSDANGDNLTANWYSASALDYYLRKHFTHGVTFGNINGMASQMLRKPLPVSWRPFSAIFSSSNNIAIFCWRMLIIQPGPLDGQPCNTHSFGRFRVGCVHLSRPFRIQDDNGETSRSDSQRKNTA